MSTVIDKEQKEKITEKKITKVNVKKKITYTYVWVCGGCGKENELISPISPTCLTYLECSCGVLMGKFDRAMIKVK